MNTLAGTGLPVRIAVRTGWPAIVVWIAGAVSLFLATALSIASLYDTPQKVAAYGASVGESMVMLTGRVDGLDTLGGVVMNEYSFLVGFGVPLMAIALTARSTRREEESGRSELLVAGGVGRLAPTAAALVVVTGAFLVLGAGLWAVTLALDVDRGGAALYAASIVATGWVYGAATAVLAQVLAHHRTVWAAALALAGLTLVTRGVGDADRSWLSWTSPLGWHGLTRPFGEASVTPLVVALVVAAALGALALGLAARRDLGSGMVPARTGPAAASRWRASPVGAAVHQHLGAVLGWTVGAIALMAVYGGLMEVAVEAVVANPDLAVVLGDPDAVVDTIVQMLVAFAGFLGAGFALQSLGGLRGEETSGRLELTLAAGRSRWAWLPGHVVVVAAGTAVVVLAGSAAFALTAAAVLDDPGLTGRVLGAGGGQIAAALVCAAVSVCLFGTAPRLQVLAWAPFALAVVVTLMGPTLRLTEAQTRLSPFGAVGAAPAGAVDPTGVAVLLAATVVLASAGLVGFRRRDVPRP